MRRTIAMLLACVMLLLCFAGCGGKDGGSDAPDTPDTAEEVTAAPADEAPADEAPAGDTAAAGSLGDGVLDTSLPVDVQTMDVMQTTKDYLVPMNIFDRLFEVKVLPDGNEIVGSLCESYEVSDDGLTYTFKLVEGVQFSNGEALTASDVVYSFTRLLAPESVNADIALEIEGAKAYQAGEADTVSGLAAPDDLTVEVTLTAPNAGFLAELTAPAMSIVDETTTEAAANFGINVEETIGSGPYIVTEWATNDHITLVRNENYWGELPSVETCIVHIVSNEALDQMYQNGELDLIDLDHMDANIVSTVYQTQYADNVIAASRAALSYMALNENNEYLADVNVRKAIQMAIDRQAIIDSVYSGQGILENAIIPSGVVAHNASGTQLAYDPEGAKALLAEAGYGEGEITIEMSYDNSANANVQLVYQIVEQQLEAVGINVEIKSYDEASWLDLRKSGEMCSFIATWTMDYNDPANIMATFFGSADNAKLRSLNYPDEEIMARVSAASSIVDDDERYAEYQALEEKIVHEDAAWVPLYNLTHLFAVSDDVASFTPHWAGYGDFYIRDVVMN